MIRLREIQSQWDTLKTKLHDPELFDGIAVDEAAQCGIKAEHCKCNLIQAVQRLLLS